MSVEEAFKLDITTLNFSVEDEITSFTVSFKDDNIEEGALDSLELELFGLSDAQS